MGNFRVTASKKGAQFYIANWCAGEKQEDVVYLLSHLVVALDKIEEQKIPISSRVKPYYNCDWFKKYLETVKPEPMELIKVHFDAKFARMMWQIVMARNINQNLAA